MLLAATLVSAATGRAQSNLVSLDPKVPSNWRTFTSTYFSNYSALWELTGIGQGTPGVTDTFNMVLGPSTTAPSFEIFVSQPSDYLSVNSVNFKYNGTTVSVANLPASATSTSFTVSFDAGVFSGTNNTLFFEEYNESGSTPNLIADVVIPEKSPWLCIAGTVLVYAGFVAWRKARPTEKQPLCPTAVTEPVGLG